MSKPNIYLTEGELLILQLLVNQGTFKGEAAHLVVELLNKLNTALEPFNTSDVAEE
tara:strand:- start:104 stop:271 length:168 start_codon:yes stop_codon:yes gene_type:complete